jgi:4'-phosphopantetheinyl transferase
MPLIVEKQVSISQTVGVWKIEESAEELLKITTLSAEETEKLNGFKADSRKKEWLATRRMLFEITGEWNTIAYRENGQPYLANSMQCLSISHTSGYAALSLQTGGAVGIDIQTVSSKIEKIKQRFLAPSEWDNYRDLDESELYLHLIWSAKEALYKVHGDNTLYFKEHLTVDNIAKIEQSGKLKASLFFNNTKEAHTLHYQGLEGCILVYLANG